MASRRTCEQIPITIQNASDSGQQIIFDAYNVQVPNDNILSLCLEAGVSTSSSLNALSLKPVPSDSGVKRHSIEALCCGLDSNACQHAHRKPNKVRDDLDVIYPKVKENVSKLSKSLSCIKTALHLSKKGKEKKPRIKVEYIDCDSTEHLWPYSASLDQEDMLDFPDHNYSPSLIITNLCDGCFSAQIPVKELPTGDLTIRIRNYKMEIVVGRRPSVVSDNHRVTYPIRHGDIDIPIYVNPATLCFELKETENVICVYGHTKGYHRPGKTSLSKHDMSKKLNLPSPNLSLKYHSDISLSKQRGKNKIQDLSPKRSLTVLPTETDAFRERALTQ